MELNEKTIGLELGIVSKGGGSGTGDMLKSVYDIDGNNIVDKSEKLDDGVNEVLPIEIKDVIGLLELDDSGDLTPRGETVQIELDGNNDLMPGIGIEILDKNFELDSNNDIQPKVT